MMTYAPLLIAPLTYTLIYIGVEELKLDKTMGIYSSTKHSQIARHFFSKLKGFEVSLRLELRAFFVETWREQPNNSHQWYMGLFSLSSFLMGLHQWSLPAWCFTQWERSQYCTLWSLLYWGISHWGLLSPFLDETSLK